MPLAWINFDCSLTDDVSKKVNFLLFELTFLGFEEKQFLFQHIEYLMHDFSVQFCVIRSGNKYVVHIPMQVFGVLLLQGSGYTIYKMLKNSGGVA
jgi:hypothetical protein